MLEITLLTLSFDDNDEWLEQRVFINVETNDFSFCFVSFLSSKEENQYMLKNLQIDEKEKVNFIQYKFFKNDIFSFEEIKEQVLLFLNKFDFKRWNNFQNSFHNIIDICEIALHIPFVENFYGIVFRNGGQKQPGRHIGTSPGTVNCKKADSSSRQLV